MNKQLLLGLMLSFSAIMLGMEAPESSENSVKSWNRQMFSEVLTALKEICSSPWHSVPKDIVAMICNFVVFDTEFQQYQNETGLFEAIEDHSPFVAQLLACGKHKDTHNQPYPKTKNGRKNEGVLEGYTPLCFAAEHSNFDAVNALLRYSDLNKEVAGCYGNAIDSDPFMEDVWAKNRLASEDDRFGTFKWQRANSDTYAIEANPLHAAATILEAPESQHHLFYECLVRDNIQNSLIIPALIQAGVPLEAVDRFGRTPLHLAVAVENRQTVDMLLRYGANVHAKSANNITPLHIAARVGSAAIIRLLHQNGAELDMQDECGRTPLFCAVMASKHESAQTLLELGASSIVPEDCGSLITLARQNGLVRAVEFLTPKQNFSEKENAKALCSGVDDKQMMNQQQQAESAKHQAGCSIQ